VIICKFEIVIIDVAEVVLTKCISNGTHEDNMMKRTYNYEILDGLVLDNQHDTSSQSDNSR